MSAAVPVPLALRDSTLVPHVVVPVDPPLPALLPPVPLVPPWLLVPPVVPVLPPAPPVAEPPVAEPPVPEPPAELAPPLPAPPVALAPPLATPPVPLTPPVPVVPPLALPPALEAPPEFVPPEAATPPEVELPPVLAIPPAPEPPATLAPPTAEVPPLLLPPVPVLPPVPAVELPLDEQAESANAPSRAQTRARPIGDPSCPHLAMSCVLARTTRRQKVALRPPVPSVFVALLVQANSIAHLQREVLDAVGMHCPMPFQGRKLRMSFGPVVIRTAGGHEPRLSLAKFSGGWYIAPIPWCAPIHAWF